MKHLIKILEESVRRHGPTKTLTVGHLLNIVKLADKLETADRHAAADLEEKWHADLMEHVSPFGQD